MRDMDLERMNTAGTNKFAKHLGITFDECASGTCTASVKIEDFHHHTGGVAQGGVAFSLADASMANALISTLETQQNCATMEMKISYLESVSEGTMICTAGIVRRGRRVAFMEAKVHNDERLVATATATFAILQGG